MPVLPAIVPVIKGLGAVADTLNDALGFTTKGSLLSSVDIARLVAEAAFKGKSAQDILNWSKKYPELFKSKEFGIYANSNPSIVSQINSLITAEEQSAQKAAFVAQGSTIEDKGRYLAAFGYIVGIGLLIGSIVWFVLKRKKR